jgi:hypothetical protein
MLYCIRVSQTSVVSWSGITTTFCLTYGQLLRGNFIVQVVRFVLTSCCFGTTCRRLPHSEGPALPVPAGQLSAFHFARRKGGRLDGADVNIR